ncbi:MAG: MFS transporter [Nitriliruptoraceae bacterium]
MSATLPLRPMAVVVAALVTGLLGSFLVGAFAVEITADLGTGPALTGLAVSAFYLTAAVSSVVSGRVVDRVGARTGYRLGLGAVVISGTTAGLLVRSGWQLVLALAIGGAAIAFIDPSIARTITGAVPPRRQGIAFGVKESSVAAASMTAGVALPLLAGWATWQVPFLVIAAVAVGLAVVIPAGIDAHHRRGANPTAPSRDGRFRRGTSGRGGSPASSEQLPPTGGSDPSSGDQDPPTATVAAPPSGRSLALLALAAGLAGGAGAVVAAYLVTAGTRAGLAPGTAALLLSLGSVVSIGVRLWSGWRADRLLGGPLPLLAGLLLAGAVGVASLAAAAWLSGTGIGGPQASSEVAGATAVVVSLLTIGAVLALGPGWGWSALVFLVAVRLVPGQPARASGAMLAGLGGGGAVFPLVAGLMIERFGFVVTWSAVAASMGVAAALTLVLHRRIPARP